MDVMSFFSDSSLCSGVFFLPWCNADHVFVSVYIDVSLDSKWDLPQLLIILVLHGIIFLII